MQPVLNGRKASFHGKKASDRGCGLKIGRIGDDRSPARRRKSTHRTWHMGCRGDNNPVASGLRHRAFEAFNSILKGILADIFVDDVDVGYTKAFDQAACDLVFGPTLMDQLPRPA